MSLPTATLSAVALTAGKNLAGQPAQESRALAIGRFGLLSDSPASACARSASPLSTCSSNYHSVHMSPSEMLEDVPSANTDCLATLESTVRDLVDQNTATLELLKTFRDKMNAAPPVVTEKPPIDTQWPNSHHSDTPASPAGRKKLSLKPSPPSVFGGDRTDGKVFLMSCRTYIRLCPEVFEEQQIIWAMSFMKDGRAARWAAREFELEATSGLLRFDDWAHFEKEFHKEFMPLNKEVDAVNVLETSAYHQGRKSVNDYLDGFRDLIHNSRYTNPKTIVVKFRRGLDRRISNALAGMTSGRLSDTNPEAWYILAVQMDQNRAADEAFYAPQRSTPPALTSHRPGLLSAPKPSSATRPTYFAHATLTPGNPVSMDIDAAHRGKTPSDSCRRCGALDHWAKDCPHRFDVRHMDTDELQTLLENKLAAKDVVPTRPPIEEADLVIPAEDFVSSSR